VQGGLAVYIRERPAIGGGELIELIIFSPRPCRNREIPDEATYRICTTIVHAREFHDRFGADVVVITLLLQREVYDHCGTEVVEMILLRQWSSQSSLTYKLLRCIDVFSKEIFDSIAVLLCRAVFRSEAKPCYRGHPLPLRSLHQYKVSSTV
jgi:hypothetical protein